MEIKPKPILCTIYANEFEYLNLLQNPVQFFIVEAYCANCRPFGIMYWHSTRNFILCARNFICSVVSYTIHSHSPFLFSQLKVICRALVLLSMQQRRQCLNTTYIYETKYTSEYVCVQYSSYCIICVNINLSSSFSIFNMYVNVLYIYFKCVTIYF